MEVWKLNFHRLEKTDGKEYKKATQDWLKERDDNLEKIKEITLE